MSSGPRRLVVPVRDHEVVAWTSGTGRPFLWTHGLTSSRRREDSWPLVRFDELAEGSTVVRYDARGHGEAGGPDDPAAYEWPELARDLLALADALGVDRFTSGGISMGTATTLHAAVAAPERIEAMVLTAPPTAWETRSAQAELYRAGADAVRGKPARALLEGLPVPEIFRDRPFESRIPDIPDDLLPTVLHGAAASDLPAPEEIRVLDVPTLVLAWAGDAGHPVSTAEALVELLPHAALHVSATFEDLATWTGRIHRFLAALP